MLIVCHVILYIILIHSKIVFQKNCHDKQAICFLHQILTNGTMALDYASYNQTFVTNLHFFYIFIEAADGMRSSS